MMSHTTRPVLTASLTVAAAALYLQAAWTPLGEAASVENGVRGSERARRWAILIGVNAYEDEQGIGALRCCVADMELLYNVLTGPYGGFRPENVLLMVDGAANPMHRPTYSNLVAMIPQWLSKVEPNDDAVIAFAGHGIEEDGTCYLLPINARQGAIRRTSLSVPQMREWLEACRGRGKVLILDACHAGAGRAPGRMSPAFRRELETASGFLRLASCDTKQKSNEDAALGHGVFTYYLADALRGKGDLDRDGRVSAFEAYRYVSREVRRWTRERGLRQDPLLSGRVVGDLTLSYVPKPGFEPDTETRARQRRRGRKKAKDEPSTDANGRPLVVARRGGRERRAGDELPPRLREHFMIPDAEKDQHGNDVVAGEGGPVDASTGWSFEIWLRQPRMEFVLAPAGEFLMGERHRGADPLAEDMRRLVRVTRPLYIGKYEVTQLQFQTVTGANPTRGRNVGRDHPVDAASYFHAVDFCHRLSSQAGTRVRLPTEAEWEYACRAGSMTRYSFGDDRKHRLISRFCWYAANSNGAVHPVGRKLPNRWGLYDMHGNAEEWCCGTGLSNQWGPQGRAAQEPTNWDAANVLRRPARGGGVFHGDYHGPDAATRRLYPVEGGKPSVVGFRCVLPLP